MREEGSSRPGRAAAATALRRGARRAARQRRGRAGRRPRLLRGRPRRARRDRRLRAPAAGRKYYLSPVTGSCYDGLPASWGLSPHRTRRCATDRSRPTSTPCPGLVARRPHRRRRLLPGGELEGDAARGAASPARCPGPAGAATTPGPRVLRGALLWSSSTGATGRARAPGVGCARWGLRRVVPRRRLKLFVSRTGRGTTRPSAGPQAQVGLAG